MRNVIRRLCGHLYPAPSVKCRLKALAGRLLHDLAVYCLQLQRQFCWLWRVIISRRRRMVNSRALGMLSVNGIRLWLFCVLLALWILVRVS
ncbi:hypothetical protein HCH73_19020 [Citrobacter koseri]|uniref:hypothetical protein n=1 Tax=Citrobacter koseri TaxID=545 RepID=UPI0018E15320|nr:hypothetical protein [Citrobacter koseri]MBI0679121.1 hypothetical protein [Citrobacter koseri]